MPLLSLCLSAAAICTVPLAHADPTRAPLLTDPGPLVTEKPEISDREPEDPAEFRLQRVPPSRPVQRGARQWLELGPTPTFSAQVRIPPDNDVTGAIHSLAPHPTNADVLYIGAVNGGIWRTNNATAARPTWIAQTAELPSQSIAAVEFDPTDPSRQTLIAGIGRWSNFARRGDDELGVYHTTDGGSTWTLYGGALLLGQRMSAVAARGPVWVAASLNGGIFRTLNGGQSFGRISGTGGLPTGGVFDMASDPAALNRLYAAVQTSPPSLWRSEDFGLTWTRVSDGVSGIAASTNNIRIAVGPAGVVYLAIVNSGRLAAVARSADLGLTWAAMDIPVIHPGGQGTSNTSIAADPQNANRVYLGGDRIANSPFTGNVVRGDFSALPGSQFSVTMDAGGSNTAPHADSRDMAFDANGNLLQTDDGGIYRRLNPASAAGSWVSVIGNLNLMEIHDLDHDGVSNILIIGTQDNGTHIQRTPVDLIWTLINGGDGGDVLADDRSQGAGGSFRYFSSQNFGSPRRRLYSPANVAGTSTALPAIADPQFVTPIELNTNSAERLLVGGVNTLYESVNATAPAPLLTSIGGPGANRNAMAYGSRSDAAVAYVGKNAQVYRRDGGAFVATAPLPAGAATITDVALDPDDDERVYAIDDDQVFASSNGGASWSDVTGNLPAVASVDFRTIEFMARASGDELALGTRSGVYRRRADGGNWELLGIGLPDVLVFDLRYVEGTQMLYAGTLGRGAWAVDLTLDDLIFRNGVDFEPKL